MLNPFISRKLAEKQGKVCKETWESMVYEAAILSKLGISSEEQQKKLFYVMTYGKPFFQEMINAELDFEKLAKIASNILSDQKNYPLDTLKGFCKAAENAINKLKLPMKKIAYPSGDTGSIESPYNIQKWMNAMREIYNHVQNGYDMNKSFDFVTKNWNIMEQNNFKRWMAFYQENAQNKYKVASSYYQSGPGAMIPMDHINEKMPDMTPFGVPASSPEQVGAAKLSKTEEIKKKIRAIISRLNAAERLATEPDVQRDLQNCLDIGVPKWLEELQRVKRLIQLAPMRSAASPILEDLIVKQANILEYHGYPIAASTMKKLAQEPAPGMTEEQNGETAIKELIEGMNFDTQEVEDLGDVDDLANIIVTAEPEPLPPAAPNPQAALEVSEDDQLESEQNSVDLFEAALANVTIPEVITKLEGVANIFRTREISRQLAMIDLMMDKLGISSYFPSLSEASSKTLESNQYALTRIEDILSKLRGSIETPAQHQIDLKGPAEPTPPVANVPVETIKSNLADQAAAEKARKEQRKKEQDAPPAPTAQPPELAQPVNIQKPPTG